MYRASSSLDDFEDKNKVLAKKTKIVMLAKADLLAECLTQAIGARFQGEDVVSLSEPDSLLDGDLVDVALILLYRIPASTFPSVIRTIHEFHPRASIGLVVENADEVDPSIAGFVDEGLIHGVLPLNLHLDVCLTAIDLLMKGASIFRPPCSGAWRPRGIRVAVCPRSRRQGPKPWLRFRRAISAGAS